jgi:hypothetical protein
MYGEVTWDMRGLRGCTFHHPGLVIGDSDDRAYACSCYGCDSFVHLAIWMVLVDVSGI